MADNGDRVTTVVTFGFIILTIVLLLSPSGVVGSRIAAWRKASAEKEAVRRSWASLDSIAQQTYGTGDSLRLVEFSDYECPFCRASEAAVSAWSTKHHEWKVGLVHFPLPIHPAAEGAARAAICADFAGKGLEMHRALMTTQEWQSDTNWRALAASINVADLNGFESCLHSQKVTNRLRRGAELATALGVTGTPAFVTPNGRAIGQQDAGALDSLR